MPKHNRNRKKKKRKNNHKNKHQNPNQSNKQQLNNKSKNTHTHNSKSQAKSQNKPPPNNNRITAVIDLQIKPPSNIPTTENPETPQAIHSPIKLHYYDADNDISDSDTHHNHPIFHNTRDKTPKMQILRSAKISHRDNNSHSSSDNNHNGSTFSPISRPVLSRPKSNNSISYLSPGFDSHHKPSLLTQHQLSPLPILHRASSEPISSTHSHSHSHSHTSPFTLTPPSILRSHSSSNDHGHVSFGEVEVHEFKLLAGSESDGVPDNGGMSLHMDQKELHNNVLHIDEYEQQRYERWKQRAQHLHWNKKKLNKALEHPEKYLFTAGRCDAFYSSLTPKEREQRLCVDKQWKRQHLEQLNAERMELDQIRKSRRKNNIFCNCKPLSGMSTSELKIVAKQYGIKVYENRKVKKGFLINQLKSKVLNYRDICCWDRISCTCVAAGIDCHCGTHEKNNQCGCVKYRRKCVNEHGRYVYKQPYYAKSLIEEWEEFYNDGDWEEDIDNRHSVSFKL